MLTRHEQAAFMAASHGRLVGEPGGCLSSLGPAAINLSLGAMRTGARTGGDAGRDQNCGSTASSGAQTPKS
ncbi:hypothetical protein GGR03_000359 [Aurantimonas endophytica]|uniref:Uncharacterized protein n=1 Tax=Aurantimonas endophytica TaxID=1522175 RepID=A0A7W6HA54_9HYPH|nr:hypothetical protein [Aurantimonas endophytica]MCO6403045.1 hypothetical protein [Aurantimonas endophytica]